MSYSGAVIMKKQNDYIRRFRSSGATRRDEAKTLAELQCRESLIFRRMISKGVFVDCGDGKFYLNDAAANEFIVERRRKAIIALIFVLAVLIWILAYVK